jgi:hypothetical protein
MVPNISTVNDESIMKTFREVRRTLEESEGEVERGKIRSKSAADQNWKVIFTANRLEEKQVR